MQTVAELKVLLPRKKWPKGVVPFRAAERKAPTVWHQRVRGLGRCSLLVNAEAPQI